jgi:hypothetical protein
LYGKKGGYNRDIRMGSLTDEEGMVIVNDYVDEDGYSLMVTSTAGDFNEDGLNDVVIGLS